MKKTVAIFGITGGIGSATRKLFLDQGYTIVPVKRTLVDLADPNADKHIQHFLDSLQPDIIINCAGYFSQNNEEAGPGVNINLNSNWAIIRHYVDKKETTVKIIMVGSSAYLNGKPQHMIYSASKAAVYNLWEGACDYFAGTNINISLVNPVRTRTKMVEPFKDNLDYLEPEDVANEILKLAEQDTSACIDMNYKDTK
jgi:short-subunit dehydrogenase